MFWIILCATVVLAWFLQNLVHESSHLVAGWFVEGRKPLKLIPWPHMYNDRFYFARCALGKSTKLLGSPKWRHVAPLMAATLSMWLWTTVLIFVPSWLVVPFLVCPLVDAGFWMAGYLRKREGTDGLRFRDTVNMERSRK